MPLPVTPYFAQRLKDLQRLSAGVAALAEAIATAHKPEAMTESAHSQTENLFDRLDEVARQDAACVLRLGIWLLGLVEMEALKPADAERFMETATALGGSQARIHDERA